MPVDNSNCAKLVDKREMRLQSPQLSRYDDVTVLRAASFFLFLILWTVPK